MIIKNTDFIYSLYDKEGINIRTFNKEYVVSFMNRNDKKVTHLLITNYLYNKLLVNCDGDIPMEASFFWAIPNQ